jgi:hypothetical protein
MDRSSLPKKLRLANIFQIGELMVWLCCSVATARRRLRDWSACSSINCNGAYYALPHVPRFDADGLWRCGDALFSRHGNLRDTVCHLVAASPAGLTSAELGAALGMEARSFLSHFRGDARLGAVREGRGDVWVSGDPEVAARQLAARRERGRAGDGLPSDAEAVLVLAEMIRRPDAGVEEVARALAARGTPVGAGPILRLLERHKLAKKGVPDSARSGS